MYQHHVFKMKFIALKYINKISRIEIGLQLFNKAFIEFFIYILLNVVLCSN